MSRSLSPWSINPRLFAAFFQENLNVLKTFCAVLLSVPESRILSCSLRSPAYPLRDYPSFQPSPPSISVSLTLFDSRILHLDISSVSESTLSHVLAAASGPFLSLLPSVSPLLPSTPFLRIFLIPPTLKTPVLHPIPFYAGYARPEPACTIRFLNLSVFFSSASSTMLHVPLHDFSRLLLVRDTRELSHLTQSYPWLISTARLLEEYLRERELSFVFREKPFSFGGHPEGILAMCSLNRLLLKEGRISELREGSQDPVVLARLFREYHQRGFL